MATPRDSVLSQLRVSDGEDAETLKKDVDPLVSFGWKIDNEGMGLEASFNFPTFAKAADFMTLVFIQSKISNHHSETYNMYRTVYLHWTTHKPRGLSLKDARMARFCHEQAISLGGQYTDDIDTWRKGCVACENPKT
ncbi:transcriptional coactivator/pterin dehydratase [Trematosphaeria pertusa]|uniref:4a-hydroxytetrahydrobiopterin dehydratase n=1 Tax=Trematosphaeria pertusa TaxID=390896 RepID=A0A6A6HV72_9PLEO|nr:transcriptional coactivator/pterin dehydratase [Trematosphaeria pertusa]KAF2241911.1 transcriptional coactivator/pterin dehydratase [Trematosphaeria pertusa]